MSSRTAAFGIATLLALLTACAQPPVAPPAVGLLDVAERPAERALLAGMRAYEDAQYAQAEKQLQAALQGNLVSPRDRAAAHKLLAFIFCTSNRMTDCEVQFRAARAADAGFALSKSEAGHPLWGPVYQRVQQR
ncbi:MAG: TssQ family T6SS-associated lipoprotein [Proteobacteria bacterium]|uniref:TssQ family T6SS-associated lipoprotein n=1 Tax=Piscinibacter sp. TaxID=1903157 RepID=UPI0035B2ED6B|nr:TssQ family T6SS-associated lipoprotein [Pseudomonadota bacterium]